MCGINGFLDFKQSHTEERRHALVHEMNEKIIYRGPDAEGIYDGRWFSMGMRRLSIVDLKSGNQPICNEDGSVAVVFNGEIYNHRSLRRQLEKRGHLFRTDSDTEVIVHLYEELGPSSFHKLDGMFAVSLYDSRKDRLYVARDKAGEKPLYYAYGNGWMCYGSELRSLMATGLIGRELDRDALNLFFTYTYIPSPYTIFKDVRKLRAGHYLCIGPDGSVQDRQYWDVTVKEQYACLSYEDAKAELRRLLNDSVKKRMDCDVPYGAFLSGGVDSGVVSALMARNSDRPVSTFTIGFEEKEYDESGNAKRVAEYLGTKHHEHILSYKESAGIAEKVIGHFDEPFADSSALPVYLVSEFASRYVKVVLTGDAGDEMFLGYDKYAVDYYLDRYLRIPAAGRKMIEGLAGRLPDKTVISRKANKVIRNAYMDDFTRRRRLMQLAFKDEELQKLFVPEYRSRVPAELAGGYFEAAPLKESLARTQYMDIKMVLEGDMLTKVDRMAMCHSLETRAPMLSSKIIDFACSIPLEYKLQGRDKKKILKEACGSLLPKGFDKLPKMGFGVPLDHWYRNEMKEELMDLLSEERLNRQGIFNGSYVAEILAEHFSGKVNRKCEIWCLYVFEKWYERCLGGNC